jgi:hypothetical protein
MLDSNKDGFVPENAWKVSFVVNKLHGTGQSPSLYYQ